MQVTVGESTYKLTGFDYGDTLVILCLCLNNGANHNKLVRIIDYVRENHRAYKRD